METCLPLATTMFWSIAGRCVGREFITACKKTISLSIVNSRHPTTFRTLSTSSFKCSHSSGKRERQVLGQWDYIVDPYCTVLSRLGCSVAVRSLDPHDFPQANQAFIVVYGSNIDRSVKERHHLVDQFKVHYDSQNKELSILADRVDSDITVELTTSVKSSK